MACLGLIYSHQLDFICSQTETRIIFLQFWNIKEKVENHVWGEYENVSLCRWALFLFFFLFSSSVAIRVEEKKGWLTAFFQPKNVIPYRNKFISWYDSVPFLCLPFSISFCLLGLPFVCIFANRKPADFEWVRVCAVCMCVKKWSRFYEM